MELAEDGVVVVVLDDPLQKTVCDKAFPLILRAARKANFVELQEWCRRKQVWPCSIPTRFRRDVQF
eukprot:2649330-Rhodomonas_salina.1